MSFVVLAGQSNALGFGNTGPAPYVPDPLTFIWDSLKHWWVQMAPGVNTGTPANPADWGPEVAFAQAFRAAHPGEVLLIVKSVKGETGLAVRPGIDWSPASHGEMFDLTAERIAAARAAFGPHAPPVDAVLWMQGEEDAADRAAAAAYGPNLQSFLAAVRARWGAEEVVLGRIGQAGAWSQDVRAAQRSVDQADGHVTSFDTIGFGLQGDGLHYDAAGQLALGRGFFDAWPY